MFLLSFLKQNIRASKILLLDQTMTLTSPVWQGTDVSPVLSDLVSALTALVAEQRLNHSVNPGDVCRGRAVYQLPRASHSITRSCQSPETPLCHLLQHRHPAERVSEDTYSILHCSKYPHPHPSIFVFFFFIVSFHLFYAPSQSPPVLAHRQ